MFKRCVIYFMIGMFGLGYVLMAELMGMNGNAITVLGVLLFYLMSIIFGIELLFKFLSLIKEESTKE